MRRFRLYAIMVAASAAASAAPATAATIIMFQDPMTMDRHTVVRNTPGRDRAFLCMLPPSDLGCREVPLVSGR